MNEDQISKNLMELNSERIRFKYIADRKNRIECNLQNLKWLLKYIKLGSINYALYRVADKFKKKDYFKTDSYEHDASLRNISDDERIAVYTVIFGKYDHLADPMYITPNCDYYIITNNDEIQSNVWRKFSIPEEIKKQVKNYTNLELARYFKLHPHLLFPDYKYSLFVDGNVQIITDVRPVVAELGNNIIAIHKQPGRDCVYQEATEIIARKKALPTEVKKQISSYLHDGFPEHYGMFQTNVVVREHNTEICKKLMEVWWNEICKYTKRDQLSFTYSLWKSGMQSTDVSILGDNTDINPRFRVSSHR